MAYWNALLRYVRFVWLSLLAPLFQQFGNQFYLLLYLRAYTTGHHAKSYLSCLINSCVIELLGVFLCNYFTPVISLCLAIGSSITILLVAPINNEQIHFSEKELAAVRTVCHKRLAILFVLHIVLLLILPISAYCISLAMYADAFLLLIAKRK